MGEIARTVTCKICGLVLIPPAVFGGLLQASDLTPGQLQTATQFAVMARHMQTKHLERDRQMETAAVGFLGLLRAMEYRTEDEAIRSARDYARWSIHQMLLTAGPRISDENIATKSQGFAADLVNIVIRELQPGASIPLLQKLQKLFAGQISELVTLIRDELEERNKYPATTTEQSHA
jgi:hypothetical protein